MRVQVKCLRAASSPDQNKSNGIAPVWANGLLATDIPHIQLEALMHQGLDVETLQPIHDPRKGCLEALVFRHAAREKRETYDGIVPLVV